MATIKKIPTRRCIGCGEHFDKPALCRVVRTPQGAIVLDASGRQAGRGAYLCRRAECLQRAKRAHRLESALEASIAEEVYLALAEEIARVTEP